MTRYGCHSAPRKPIYQVHVRHYQPDGSWLLKRAWIEARGSAACQYDMKAADSRCQGCRK
jgi:hypothetical protein